METQFRQMPVVPVFRARSSSWRSGNGVVGYVHQNTETGTMIQSLKAFGFELKKPIPIAIDDLNDGEFLASWKEAEISMSGSSGTEAMRGLILSIIKIYKHYSSGVPLGPVPARQLRVLEKYIG